ncbi:MAG: glutaredoxin family protein, partial [Betaproteobacteria bacterium]|nr:glutaredoxin family protein [Betaproteobacteria bacterium]
MRRAPPDVLIALALLAGLLAPLSASASPYKWQDESGRVVYGDRPPHMDAKQLSGGAFLPPRDQASAANEAQPVPALLRPVVTRSPVVLYTSRNCEPCRVAREYLTARGVPFTEKTLGTEADVAAFKALGFTEMTVPTASVGAERLIGFETTSWNRALDVAGYPGRSLLPSNWVQPRAEPLAPAVPIAPAARPPGGQVVERPVRDPAREDPPAAALIQA